MNNSPSHIFVCVCTYRRPAQLRRLLESLAGQRTDDRIRFSVVVADNDPAQSAAAVVEDFPATGGIVEMIYTAEPVRNIALVRNAALRHAKGELAAFIDDDEFAVEEWLLQALETLRLHDASGVLGPVLPHFDGNAPEWVKKGGFFDRPRHPTGFELDWQECRTGNVLFKTGILRDIDGPFSEEFATGGEDQDFFRRLIAAGHRFIWCDEAIAFEEVPPSRCERRFLFQRALLRGQDCLKHRRGRVALLCKSLIAVPAYTLALGPLALTGHHRFMRYLIKLGDHWGRLLASVGIRLVRERQM